MENAFFQNLSNMPTSAAGKLIEVFSPADNEVCSVAAWSSFVKTTHEPFSQFEPRKQVEKKNSSTKPVLLRSNVYIRQATVFVLLS